jgi:hypothetical protein
LLLQLVANDQNSNLHLLERNLVDISSQSKGDIAVQWNTITAQWTALDL